MPKYVAITPTFTPYSTEELMRVPLQMMSEAKEQQKIYDEQMDKLAAVEALAGNNPELKEYMQPYYDARDKAVEAMSGTYYNPDIVSQNKALKDIWRDRGLKAQAGINAQAEYNKARPQDAIGGNHTLMEFINNPSLQADYVSGDKVEKTASDIISKMAASLPPVERGKFLSNSQVMLTQGYSLDEIANAMSGNGNTGLSATLQGIRNQYGYNNLSQADRAIFDTRLHNGAMSGLEKMSTVANPDYLNPLQRQSLANARTEGAMASLKYKEAKENYDTYGSTTKPSSTDVPAPIDLGNGTSVVYDKANKLYKIMDNTTGKVISISAKAPDGTKPAEESGGATIYRPDHPKKDNSKYTSGYYDMSNFDSDNWQPVAQYKNEKGVMTNAPKGYQAYYNEGTKEYIVVKGSTEYTSGTNYNRG